MTGEELQAWRLDCANIVSGLLPISCPSKRKAAFAIEYARLVTEGVRPQPVVDEADRCLTDVLRVIGHSINSAFRANAESVISAYGDKRAADVLSGIVSNTNMENYDAHKTGE